MQLFSSTTSINFLKVTTISTLKKQERQEDIFLSLQLIKSKLSVLRTHQISFEY